MFMKFSRIITLLLAVSLLLGSCATSGSLTDGTTAGSDNGGASTTAATSNTSDSGSQPTPDNIFDEDNIVLSFGALSDIHITANKNDDSESKFRAAITQLTEYAKKHDANGLDAIAIAGDITDNGTAAQVDLFAEIVSDMDVKNLMFATGNHDIRNTTGTMQGFINALEDEYFDNDVDESMLEYGARHCVLNGAHFIFIEPSAYGNDCPYNDKVLSWLDTTLADITATDPNAYIFVFTHPMLYDTCYGSTLSGGSWYTVHLTATLSKYPQVMTFGGHLHFPVNDERTIMQDSFTSLGCGSVRYLAIERGFSNMASATVPKDAYDVSSGLLVQVDGNGNVRITRMNFSGNSTFKEPWELSHPDSDGKHLTKYTKDRGDENQAPVLTKAPSLNVTLSASGAVTNSSVTVYAASDDDFAHHYKVVVKNLTLNTIENFNFLSDFYRHKQPSEMATELTFPLSISDLGAYRVEVTAIDSWNAESNMMYCEKLVGDVGGGSSEELPAELPAVYTDFEFVNGQITDTKNKFTVDIQGATIEDTTLTFAGATKTVSAFRVKQKGQHATLRFKDYNESTMTNFYNSSTGYTIEALYVNYSPSGKQGIVCGTQHGGVGLAESDGNPYYYTYTTDGNINASANVATSNTELTHIVCTSIYNASTNRTYTAVYINGELVVSGSEAGMVKVSANANIATALCLGADIASNGKGDDFQTSSFALADVKIYAESLNYKQVETAYQNAVTEFAK